MKDVQLCDWQHHAKEDNAVTEPLPAKRSFKERPFDIETSQMLVKGISCYSLYKDKYQ